MLTEHSTRSADTRTKILEAAFQILARQGYENTSIKDIAEEAGVAQGLVHYHFKSKQQLVLAVLAEVCREMEFGDAQGAAGAQAAYEKFKNMLKGSQATHALYIQLIAMGLHDKELGAGVLSFVRQDRAHIEDIARQVLAEREADPKPARAIASVIEAAVLGIMVQNLIDPEFNAEEAVDALNAMSLSAVFAEEK
ncbi:MAG: TetR/AcrR family transcriptional regulator [Chloroflexi bacterium]|nr:MAG: TetR/AcrR family transcriptional regulator [Chloroflexota bacterium]